MASTPYKGRLHAADEIHKATALGWYIAWICFAFRCFELRRRRWRETRQAERGVASFGRGYAAKSKQARLRYGLLPSPLIRTPHPKPPLKKTPHFFLFFSLLLLSLPPPGCFVFAIDGLVKSHRRRYVARRWWQAARWALGLKSLRAAWAGFCGCCFAGCGEVQQPGRAESARQPERPCTEVNLVEGKWGLPIIMSALRRTSCNSTLGRWGRRRVRTFVSSWLQVFNDAGKRKKETRRLAGIAAVLVCVLQVYLQIALPFDYANICIAFLFSLLCYGVVLLPIIVLHLLFYSKLHRVSSCVTSE